MKTLVATGGTVNWRGAWYSRGARMEEDDEAAQAALATGDWAVAETPAETVKIAKVEQAIAALVGVVLTAADDASAAAAYVDGFTKGGLPEVSALEKLLELDVSAQERDEAWASWKEANPETAAQLAGD